MSSSEYNELKDSENKSRIYLDHCNSYKCTEKPTSIVHEGMGKDYAYTFKYVLCAKHEEERAATRKVNK